MIILIENHSIEIDDEELKRYSKNWHRPAAAKDLERYDESEQDKDTNVRLLYEPRGAQIEALCALDNSREEGVKRALVQAATGIGKTYLAAFDSKSLRGWEACLTGLIFLLQAASWLFLASPEYTLLQPSSLSFCQKAKPMK